MCLFSGDSQLWFGQRYVCDLAKGNKCVVECFGRHLAVESADEDCGFLARLV